MASADPGISPAELKASASEAQQQCTNGELGTMSGLVAIPGRIMGWNDRLAVLQPPFLRFFSNGENIVGGLPTHCFHVAGCAAALAAPGKHSSDHVIELTIAEPRSVQIFRAPSADSAEAWISALTSVEVQQAALDGHVGNLSEAQTTALADLKATGNAKESDTDADLLRFLRNASWNVASAANLLKEYHIWREQFNVERLKISSVAKECKTGKIHLLPGTDKHNRPVLVIFPGKHFPAQSSPVDVSKLLVYMVEKAIKSMTGNIEQLSIIVDMSGMRPRNADIRVPKLLLETLQNRYPGRIGLILVVNAPWFFRFLWFTIKTFFSPETHKKVHILGMDMQTLQAFVSTDTLLRVHGGVAEFSADEFIAATAAEEGVEVGDVESAAAGDGEMDATLFESLKSLPAATVSEGAVKTGYMTKLGGIVKNWKKRYFVLSDAGILYYYKSDKATEPQDVVVLDRCSVAPSTAKSHGFSLVHPLRTYEFACDNDQDRDDWFKAIGSVCEKM